MPTLSRGCYFIQRVAGYIRRGSDTRSSLPLSRLSGPIYIPDSGSRECRSAATNVHRELSGLVVVIRFRHPSASYRLRLLADAVAAAAAERALTLLLLQCSSAPFLYSVVVLCKWSADGFP